MDSFQYTSPLQRVVLAENAVDQAGQEIAQLGCSQALVICGPNTRKTRLFQRTLTALGPACSGILDEVVEHSHTDLVTRGAERARQLGIDVLVAVGGGSASDTAKGIAILLAEGGRIHEHASTFVPPDKFYPKELPAPKLPVVTIPSTASAAEVTPGLGIKDERGVKLLFWDVKLASRVIILDPAANVEVPASLMATTAMNAFAHCIEGLYSRHRNPISEGLALQGIRMLSRSIPRMVQEPEEVAARADVMAGANLSGMVISNARVGIHHAMCHCLGARGGVPHGVANAIMLPHALRYNAEVAAGQLRLAAEAMGKDVRGRSDLETAQLAIAAVEEMQSAARVPRRLRETGLAREMLPDIAADTLRDRGLYFNPRVTDSAEPVLAILEAAW